VRNETFDLVSLKILWDRLIAITDEAAVALVKTAFSTGVRESRDFAIVLFDSQGRTLSQSSASIPSFLGTLPATMKSFLERYPVDQWRPGDVVITNDPWLGTGHLPDVNISYPIFSANSLIGFVGVVAHASDMGGGPLSASAREVYEEGIRIPILRLCKEGQFDETLLEIVRANVRVPEEVIGDFEAMVSACKTAEFRLLKLIDEVKLNDLDSLTDEIQERSEASMRASIREIPDGSYTHEVWMDGFESPIKIRNTVKVADTDVFVDYEGTSLQVQRGINSVLTYTRSYTLYPLKCAINPSLPNNEGTFRPFKITAPEATILNPSFPAPVTGRNITGHFLSAAVFGALAQAIPEKVIAGSGAPRPVITMRGIGKEGQPFSKIFFLMGGLGANISSDGISCLAFPTNTSYTPIEVMENTAPVLFNKREFLSDSGGAGKFRGGLGQMVEIKNVANSPVTAGLLADRTKFPSDGLFGGKPGGLTKVWLESGKPVDPKGTVIIEPGDTILVHTPGGGGYGDPRMRDRVAIEQDVKNGLITESQAEEVYGFNSLSTGPVK
jgi:N-methylhydantoinase B